MGQVLTGNIIRIGGRHFGSRQSTAFALCVGRPVDESALRTFNALHNGIPFEVSVEESERRDAVSVLNVEREVADYQPSQKTSYNLAPSDDKNYFQIGGDSFRHLGFFDKR